MAKFKVDRLKFIQYYPVQVAMSIALDHVQDDLVKGGEFILSAEQILKMVPDVPKYLLVDYTGDQRTVPNTECEFIYVQR